MTPAHTHLAREILGEDSLLVVVQAVVLNQDREEALRRAHDNLSIYTELPNYRNHLLREGLPFTSPAGCGLKQGPDLAIREVASNVLEFRPWRT
jgi:hypothetical protein